MLAAIDLSQQGQGGLFARNLDLGDQSEKVFAKLIGNIMEGYETVIEQIPAVGKSEAEQQSQDCGHDHADGQIAEFRLRGGGGLQNRKPFLLDIFVQIRVPSRWS
jgi:hypothetical protein